jgi:transposase-like protein
MRPTYTDEQRAEALALYADVGVSEAARRTGIPAGTIASWANRAGIQPEANENLRAAVEARRLTWAERKTALATRLGEIADQAAEQLAAKIAANELSGRDLIAALTALIDRTQLLTGEATARTESTVAVNDAREQALALVKQLGERRAA